MRKEKTAVFVCVTCERKDGVYVIEIWKVIKWTDQQWGGGIMSEGKILSALLKVNTNALCGYIKVLATS